MGPRALPLLIALAVLAAGVLAAPAAAAPAAGCHPEWPVTVHRAGGVVVRPAAGSGPTVVPCATETGYETSETTIAATRSGAIFFSPAHTENSIARSTDGAATWQLTYPPKMQYTSLWNTVDPYLVSDPRTGRLFWSHATGPTRTTPVVVDESPFGNGLPTALAGAYGFQVYSTGDDGRTWLTADYQTAPVADWEKVFVGPPRPASSGAPQPVGYPDVVYLCGNAPLEVSGPGRLCYRSLDGGATFNPAGLVYPTAATPDLCPALAANNGVVGADGTIYHPVSCRGASYVAISRDEGSTYEWHAVPSAPPANGLAGTLQLAVDESDALYALWTRPDGLFLAVSHDHAGTWGPPMMVTAPGLRKTDLPVIAAGAAGRVGIAYYGSTDAGATAMSAYLTQTDDALAAQPTFISAALNDPAHPIFTDAGLGTTPRADYVGATFDASGTFWAGVAKQLGPPDGAGNVATTGYVGRLAAASASAPVTAPRRTAAKRYNRKARRRHHRRARRHVRRHPRFTG